MRSSNYQDSLVDLTGVEIRKENNGQKKCHWENCSTKLNSYNPNGYCHAHVSKGVWKEAKEEDEKKQVYTRKASAVWQAKQKKKKGSRKRATM